MNESILHNLCDTYGVDWDVPPKTRPIRQEKAIELALDCDETSQQTLYQLAADTSIDEETGTPGTPVSRGNVRTPVSKYSSSKVRGTRGSWGLFEKHFRNEPQIYDPVTSISEALASASYAVQMPDEIRRSQQSAVEAFVDWTNGWLHSLGKTLPHLVSEAGETLLIYGPCVHEVVWTEGDDHGRRYPVKLGYREPSTYDEWLLNEPEDELVGVKFEPSTGNSYVLEHDDDLSGRPPGKKMIHTAYHQRGNNFDGVPPTRPCVMFKKLKKVLLQIAVLTADKYGVPVAKVVDKLQVDLDGEWSPPEGTADDSDKNELYSQALQQRSGQAPVYKIPTGLDLEYEAPPGQMPSLLDLLEYCDSQMAQCFTNQGALLGQQSAVGSYALGKVSDDKFVRQAPAVARMVLRPINQLIRLVAKRELEDRGGFEALPAYPTVGMQLHGQIDASKWIEDMTKLMGGKPITQWPTGLQAAALDKLDLDPEVLERQEAETETPGNEDIEDQPDDAPDTEGAV